MLAVEGWRAPERFVAPIEFGNLWHTCEEVAAQERSWSDGNLKGTDTTAWEDSLTAHYTELVAKYPFDRDEIAQWYDKCRALFPLYVRHWAEHGHVTGRTPLLSEQAFDVPYRLPSGRTVRLRGKWDSVDLVDGAVWLQENKTKSTIDAQKLTRQLTWDLQTMLYLIALGQHGTRYKDRLWPLRGVRYNVVRRSAHKGGRGKSAAQSMLDKFHEDRDAGRVSEWFARWEVEVGPEDVARFRQRCLDPLLERLCLWWDAMEQCNGNPWGEGTPTNHWVTPFTSHGTGGIEGGTDLDEAVLTGSTVGLVKATTMFPELT